MRDIYYEEELRYLKEEGTRFAKKHPHRAKYLNLESAKARDPNVETLFEGFAFLCAGIRERVDAALPELASGLAGLLWPQLLHPIPSACIAEFRPRAGMFQGGHVVEKGTALFTDPDPATGVSCRFATTQDVRVNPIAISKVGAATNAGGKDVLTVSFKFEQGKHSGPMPLSPVRIFINDELPNALLIRKMLLCHSEEVILRDSSGLAKLLDPKSTFIEGGFGENENLFPEPQNVSRPLGLLRDYFAFPERFLFIDIYGLDSLPSNDAASSTLSLEIRFDRKLSNIIHLTRETFKLHCAPAVNVFRRDAEPLIADGKKCEYDLVSDAAYPECYAIHSVDSVTGIDCVTGERREYERYCKFGDVGKQRFYSIRAERSSEDSRQTGGERRMILCMNGRQTENGRLKRETLNIEAWQTNGALAHKILSEGGLLRKASPGFSDGIAFSNLTIPTPPVNPPPGDEYIWAFLSHLSCTYSNFSDAERLKEFLRVYDWTGTGGKRPEIESLRSVSIRPCDMAIGRAVIRGTEMNIAADESAAPEESIFLLGTTLARSLSCMGSINTFLKLALTMSVSGKTFEWYCRAGERLVI